MKYIQIINFEEHQHYGNRNVIWIKLYTKLLTSFKLLQLTPTERWLYITLLLLAPQKANKLQCDCTYLAHISGLNRPYLVQAGLKKMAKVELIKIKTDSKMLARRYQDASNKREEEKERKIREEVNTFKNKIYEKSSILKSP